MPDSAAALPADRSVASAAARIAGTAVLAVAPWIFVLALQPLAYGIWFQAEPVTVGLLVLGAMAGASLIALAATGHPVREAATRPPVCLLAAFVAWNGFASIWQAFPARTWFGAPEIGEGVFAFLALLLLVMVALVLWPIRWCRFAAAGSAAASAVVIGVLDAVLPLGSLWRPEMWASYAGAIGPAVALIVAGAALRPGWKQIGLGVLVGLPVVLSSANKTAIGLYCVIGPLAMLAASRLSADRLRSRRVLAWAPIAAVVAVGIVLAVPLAFPLYDPLYSLRSRGLLALAGIEGLLARPFALLFGFGWGSFNDVLYRHTFIWDVRGFRDGVWNPNWESVNAGAFHSHYEVLETVLAAGLIGAVLYLLLFRSLVWHARRELLALAAVAWVLQLSGASFWFPFTLSFPFLAMAMAGSIAPLDAPSPRLVRRLPRWQTGGLVLAVLALLWGAQATARDALAGGRLIHALGRQDAAEAAQFGTAAPDHGRGGAHLWWAALDFAAFIHNRIAAGQSLSEGQVAWYGTLLQQVDARIAQDRAGVRLLALGLALRNELFANQPNAALDPLRQRELASWPDAVIQVIRAAPDRTDVAVPYLAWLMAAKRYVPVLALCGRVFSLHPQDRVCLWYSGIAMLTDPLTEQRGLAQLRQALAMGVDTVAPVTPAARAQVEASGKRAP